MILRRLACVVGSVVCLLAVSSRASADEQAGAPVAGEAASDVWSKRVAILASAGLGTPIGYYGLSAEYAPHPALVVSGGIGEGSGPLHGSYGGGCPGPGSGVCGEPFVHNLQYALLARYRFLRREQQALSLGAGPSMGGYSWTELTTDEPAHKSSDLAYWLDVELSSEWRARWGGSARLFLGYAFMLNPGALHCVETGTNVGHCEKDHAADGHRLLYLGGAVGWAF